jgi:hypothetical protein
MVRTLSAPAPFTNMSLGPIMSLQHQIPPAMVTLCPFPIRNITFVSNQMHF